MRSQKHYRIVVILSVVVLSSLLRMQAQPAQARAASNTRAVRGLLSRFEHVIHGFDKRRLTIVFSVSMEQCVGCCAAAVNDILLQIANGKWDVNAVVLVKARFPEEVAAVESSFRTPNVIADERGQGWSALAAAGDVPCMFVVELGARVLIRWRDIQHNRIDAPILNGIRWAIQPPATVRPKWETRLAETKDQVVLDAYSPSCTDGILLFVDPRQGTINRYSAIDGSVRSIITIPDTVSLRFQRSTDDLRYWKSLREHVSPLTLLYGARVSGSPDTITVLGTFHAGYDSSPMADGRTMVVWNKRYCLASVVDGTMRTIEPLRRANFSFLPPVVFDSAGSVIGQFVSDDDSSNGNGGRVAFALTRASVAHGEYQPIASTADLERQIGTRLPFDPSAIPCVGPKGSVIFYDQANGVLASCTQYGDTGSGRSVAMWNMAPMLADGSYVVRQHVDMIPREGPQVTADPAEDHAAIEDRQVMGVSCNGTTVDVVAIETIGRKDVVSVRRADFDGTIRAEVSVARKNDTPVSAYPIGYRDGCLMVLVKWEHARWVITGIRL